MFFEDLIKTNRRILCGTCEKNGKWYAKELKPGEQYRCDICRITFNAAGQRINRKSP